MLLIGVALVVADTIDDSDSDALYQDIRSTASGASLPSETTQHAIPPRRFILPARPLSCGLSRPFHFRCLCTVLNVQSGVVPEHKDILFTNFRFKDLPNLNSGAYVGNWVVRPNWFQTVRQGMLQSTLSDMSHTCHRLYAIGAVRQHHLRAVR